MDDFIDIVFDGPPSAPMPRLRGIEGPDGRAIEVGEWVTRSDGSTAVRLRDGDLNKALASQAPDPTVYPSDE